jgi:hypothetical protein
MKYPPYLPQRRATRFDRLNQLRSGDVIVESERRKVSPFFVRSKLVTDQDILETQPIQTPDEGTPDEAGSPGDEDTALF